MLRLTVDTQHTSVQGDIRHQGQNLDIGGGPDRTEEKVISLIALQIHWGKKQYKFIFYIHCTYHKLQSVYVMNDSMIGGNFNKSRHREILESR